MMGKHYSFLCKNPREIRLTYDKGPITTGAAFKRMYRGLSPLIKKNIKKTLDPGRIIKTSIPTDNYHRPYVTDWKKELSEQGIHFNGDGLMKAEVKFDDGSTTQYLLTPRTNFAHNLVKYPNIIQMNGEDGTKATLREARVNAYSPILRKLTRNTFGNAVDDEVNSQFEKETLETLLKPDRRKAALIPEPYLLEALEYLYFNVDLPRITPEIRIVDSSHDKLWYVRNFLPVLEDTEFSPDKMGEYFGVLHGLGLMEIIDRQLIHYAEENGRVVNYDPDFYSFTEKETLRTQKDFDDFRKELDDEFKSSGIDYIDGDGIVQIRKIASRQAKELEKEGITPSAFYDALPLSLDTRKSNALSRLHIEQPESVMDLVFRTEV